MRVFILWLFGLHFIFLAYLNNVYLAGLPLRSLVLLSAAGLSILMDTSILTRLKPASLVYLALALLGLFVSLANEVSLAKILDGELKLLQSYLVILLTLYLLEQFGFRRVSMIVLLLTLPSALLGILQWLNVPFAWSLQDAVANLQSVRMDTETLNMMLEQRARPPGLALFAILQSYLLLSAMMLCLYCLRLYRHDQYRQLLVTGISFILLGGIFATETRSAIMAALLMFVIVHAVYFPSRTLIAGIITTLLGIFVYVYIGGDFSTDSRLVSLDDQSAAGRYTLYKYGADLFLNQPFGYGFGFSSMDYATNFFFNNHHVFDYHPDEKDQYLVPVHNFILNLVQFYGLPVLLVLSYYLYQLAKGSWLRTLFIVGAILNALFHNAGILNNDLFMDIVIAVMIFESHQYLTVEGKMPLNPAEEHGNPGQNAAA